MVGFDRLATTGPRSLCAADVEAGVEELDRGVADALVDRGTVHACCVDAGLREFIPAVLIAFVDEDVVVDAAGDHIELGMGNVLRGELGVVLGRRLGVAGARR